MLNYSHILDGQVCTLPVGKVVCVGRNYAEHARELNNPVPPEPVLFIKPATSLAFLEEPIHMPGESGPCHFETEMALLIGGSLTSATVLQAEKAIAGVGVALDLTLREVQKQLKDKGLPWEKAKAFDGACPVSAFISPEKIGDFQKQQIQFWQNGELRQDGSTEDMLMSVLLLLVYISQFFSLQPADIVLTGTPAGVGPLYPGDQLKISLSGKLNIETQVKDKTG